LSQHHQPEAWPKKGHIQIEGLFEEHPQGVGEQQNGDAQNHAGEYQRGQHEKVKRLLEAKILLLEEKCAAGADKG
jgi:hypothetical protein